MSLIIFHQQPLGSNIASPIAMNTDGLFVYVSVTQALCKCDKNTLEVITILDLSGYCTAPHGIQIESSVIINGFLYGVVPGIPESLVIKVNLSTFTVDGAFVVAGRAFRIVSDNTNLYIGCRDTPATVSKYDLDINLLATWTGSPGENDIYSMILLSDSIYIGLDMLSPTKIIRLNLLLTKIAEWISGAGEDYVDALATDGSYLYAGLYTNPTIIKKFTVDTLQEVNSATLSGQSMYGIGYSNGKLYIAADGAAYGLISVVGITGFIEQDTLSLSYGGVRFPYQLIMTAEGLLLSSYSNTHNSPDSIAYLGEEIDVFHGASAGSASFEEQLSQLLPDTDYLAMAYADDGADLYFGNEVLFHTLDTAIQPVVATDPVTDISRHTAVGNGQLLSDGGAPCIVGFEYGLDNTFQTFNEVSLPSVRSPYPFSIQLFDLSASTTYYIRAFAEHSARVYGATRSFTTLAALEPIFDFPSFGIDISSALGFALAQQPKRDILKELKQIEATLTRVQTKDVNLVLYHIRLAIILVQEMQDAEKNRKAASSRQGSNLRRKA